jgi:hypothetical protein
MGFDIIYVAQGRIHFKEPGKPARAIESKFGQSLIDRTNQIHQRNSWKTEGTGARFMSGRALWAGQALQDQEEYPVVVNAVSRGMRREIFFFLWQRWKLVASSALISKVKTSGDCCILLIFASASLVQTYPRTRLHA